MPYTSMNKLLEHLASIYKDQDVKLTARNVYKNLRMGTTKLFTTFYSNFAWITSVLLYDEHTLIDDLKDRLVCHLQDALALCGAEFKDMALSKHIYNQQTRHNIHYSSSDRTTKKTRPQALASPRTLQTCLGLLPPYA